MLQIYVAIRFYQYKKLSVDYVQFYNYRNDSNDIFRLHFKLARNFRQYLFPGICWTFKTFSNFKVGTGIDLVLRTRKSTSNGYSEKSILTF